MNTEEVMRLKRSLTKAIEEDKILIILDIMRRFNDEVVATKELLKNTGIGVFIGKQRSHHNADVAKLAKDIVKKWKTVLNGGFVKPNPVNKIVPNPKNVAKQRDNSREEINSPSSLKTENSQNTQSNSSSPSPNNVKTNNGKPYAGDRTFRKDNMKGHTGYDIRDKCIELLYDSLAFDSSAGSDIIFNCAVRIEQIVLDQFKGEPEKQYRDKLRGLISNLKDKKNPGLRKGIVSGEIPVEEFCVMSKEEKKAKDREIKIANLFKARSAGQTQAETNMFRCGKCGERKATYYQMQTRSADEPMTTFVTCTNCNNRWKFC
ncbi:19974_t:CDS:2 [Funneliformis geosporum]|uniref:Transcription elongation factor n=1 Tax=Funneliformis geosporum TaxID=1117311 RepID=A0A9W4X2I7_9GLOM|nr:8227_t:CDS:2 [Funneliformis geosporum]CAI2181826.1 19974_t:CDS:2 [Funneliformis geosporum]